MRIVMRKLCAKRLTHQLSACKTSIVNMSASRTKTVRLSHDLADALEIIAKRSEYKTLTALIEGLARYHCLTNSRHTVTTKWAKLTPAEQDELDAKLLARILRGDGMTAADAAKVDWRTL